MFYLEHIQGTALVALTDHHLAHQTGILSHQHVLELVDLNQKKRSHSLILCGLIQHNTNLAGLKCWQMYYSGIVYRLGLKHPNLVERGLLLLLLVLLNSRGEGSGSRAEAKAGQFLSYMYQHSFNHYTLFRSNLTGFDI